MIPGESIIQTGNIERNAGAPQLALDVANTGNGPIQIGARSHFHGTNGRFRFAAGTALPIEPRQTRAVRLAPPVGTRTVFGFRGKIRGALR